MNERIKKNYKEYYEIIEVIGIGGYGCVYKGRDKNTKEMRAIKVMSIETIRGNLAFKYEIEEIEEQLKKCIEGFIEEYKIMKICSKNNENSVKCYEYFKDENNFVIIMELCDQNLDQLLNKRLKEKKNGFNIKEIYEIMKQLNNTFKIMKENKIIHRDLKLENILIKYKDKEHKNYIIKLSDYGCSKRLESLSRGTLVYMSPEILKGEEYNYKCDIWSIGIIIYRLIFGKSPYLGENEIALINNIEKNGNKLIKKTKNKELDDLIIKLIEKDLLKRIGWDEYLNHSFFKLFISSKSEYKNKIKLIYYSYEEEEQNIFGGKFVENNKNNIDLMINGVKNELIEKYKLCSVDVNHYQI